MTPTPILYPVEPGDQSASTPRGGGSAARFGAPTVTADEVRPLYATEVVVSATPEEVQLDFFCSIKPPTAHLARIVISRPHTERLRALLDQVLSAHPIAPDGAFLTPPPSN